MQEFDQSGNALKNLPTAVFLVGYILGSMVFSIMSETIGRKPVLVGTFTVFVLATLACAFAPNWGFFLAFRMIVGLAGAAPQTVVGGLYADMFFDERTRGRAMVSYMSVGDLSLDTCALLMELEGWKFRSNYGTDYFRVFCSIWLEMDVSN